MEMAYFYPKYWGIWLFVGVAKLLVLLPYQTQLALGRWIGRAGLKFSKRRRRIAEVNIRCCFPGLSHEAQQALLKASFESVGMGGMETLMAWFMPEKRFRAIPFKYEGVDEIKRVLEQGTGVLMCGGHFTCLELIGRKFGLLQSYKLVYQKHKNPLMEKIITGHREKYVSQCIKRQDMRTMVKVLRRGELLWFAPDQDLGRQHSVFVNFFNIPTATVTAFSGLARLGQAKVFPAFFYRLPDGKGYYGKAGPAFNHFPSSEAEDAQRYNDALEEMVRKYPEQYLWQHRRFKTRPEGESSFY